VSGRPLHPTMVSYAAGFMFSADRHQVALALKQKPAWQAGRLNAIGGKIEAGETALQCMVREFAEEAGVETAPEDWQAVATLKGEGFAVHFFAAFNDLVFDVHTVEAEEIVVGYVASFLAAPNLIPNLRVFMPLALDETGIAKPVHFADVAPVQA
jgi:8-oxo-dGTP diphosphatase